jgi:hypothetical protein
MFVYHSEQRHSDFVQGRGETRIQRVVVNGAKGHKEVEFQDASGRITRRVKMALKPREVEQIKKNQYIKGLFQECDDNMCEVSPLLSFARSTTRKGSRQKGSRKGTKGR